MIDSPGKPEMRYAPHDFEFYRPAGDARVDRTTVWNLAYLSHPFETSPMHQDPHFLTAVRQTCQYDLTTGRVDLTFGVRGHPDNLLDSKLRMPAPWFVNWLNKNKVLTLSLPMYQRYGSSWLATIEARARACNTYEQEPEEPLHSLQEARALLLKFQRR